MLVLYIIGKSFQQSCTNWTGFLLRLVRTYQLNLKQESWKMLSKKSGKLFKIVIRWCNICGGMPFIWNGRRGKVCITRKGQIRWGLAFLVQLSLCIYTYFKLFQLVTDLGDLQQCKSRKFVNMIGGKLLKMSTPKSLVKIDAELAYCFIHALIYTFMIALNINTILNQREIVLFTNTYLKFTSHFRGK